ncbi:response regulator transcription factor [Paenibacillus macquariensis]|uniref:DNA-binding response regulator, OmpR family, contains REC and winged-helix (WHTH) domain n=1 Tax=Paenibacillus macquariensis TaxID=948756 RepID=A0ABY1JPS8_9BACL|nr:response regulator transcription factor [Paenibacillus macquariensis]MEC0094051.1 response regulator transcription factor [Paenibacillus macquariensis]OAB37584.1 DNA-binding response regulator [Paenibacillus macquariensis subsp. macquariensis]SIQ55253.1 DNA-binding response regulator, OmpR family, contains REC and winged-helix (wHTH) domain [Paenibacillus macquariensis]
MNTAAILLVDDEQSILELMLTVLRKEGYTNVDTVMTGEAAIAACEAKIYDLIILDVLLPGRSGIEICPFLRQTTDAPILFLTARESDFDKLTGFAVGGDDYITKPFNPMEVVARIRSHLRRYLGAKHAAKVQPSDKINAMYDYGHFQVDETAGMLRVEQTVVACPALVFQLLLFLCKNPNRLFSKSELYESVWGEEALHDDNTVMVHIHRIRERIEPDPANPIFIVNVRGLGYKLVQAETWSPQQL